MDDLDWCYRFKQRGWKVWYEGSVTVIHVKGGTTVEARRRGRHRGLRHNVAFHRGMGRFYRKFYAGERPLVDAAIYLAIGGKLAVLGVRAARSRAGASPRWRQATVSAIVVNYRRPDILGACLRSLRRSARAQTGAARRELVVVDNASGDDSLEVVADGSRPTRSSSRCRRTSASRPP